LRGHFCFDDLAVDSGEGTNCGGGEVFREEGLGSFTATGKHGDYTNWSKERTPSCYSGNLTFV